MWADQRTPVPGFLLQVTGHPAARALLVWLVSLHQLQQQQLVVGLLNGHPGQLVVLLLVLLLVVQEPQQAQVVKDSMRANTTAADCL